MGRANDIERRSLGRDLYQFRPLAGGQVQRQQIADVRGVELVLDVPGRQG